MDKLKRFLAYAKVPFLISGAVLYGFALITLTLALMNTQRSDLALGILLGNGAVVFVGVLVNGFLAEERQRDARISANIAEKLMYQRREEMMEAAQAQAWQAKAAQVAGIGALGSSLGALNQPTPSKLRPGP